MTGGDTVGRGGRSFRGSVDIPRMAVLTYHARVDTGGRAHVSDSSKRRIIGRTYVAIAFVHVDLWDGDRGSIW